MQASIEYWLTASYRQNEPEMAQDAPDAGGGFRLQQSPARALRAAVRRLARRWNKRFDDLSADMAKHFADDAMKHSDNALRSMLKKSGFAVEFKLTAEANDVLQATTAANVALIKSIPAQYMTDVEGIVMRSVQAGRDIGGLSKELQARYGVTRRRAALIARTQNNLATATITRVRQQSLGITKAIWQHSHGGKEPRPSHVANSGKEYDVAKGWFDPEEGRLVFPGELIGCRCVSISVIPGFN